MCPISNFWNKSTDTPKRGNLKIRFFYTELMKSTRHKRRWWSPEAIKGTNKRTTPQCSLSVNSKKPWRCLKLVRIFTNVLLGDARRILALSALSVSHVLRILIQFPNHKDGITQLSCAEEGGNLYILWINGSLVVSDDHVAAGCCFPIVLN